MRYLPERSKRHNPQGPTAIPLPPKQHHMPKATPPRTPIPSPMRPVNTRTTRTVALSHVHGESAQSVSPDSTVLDASSAHLVPPARHHPLALLTKVKAKELPISAIGLGYIGRLYRLHRRHAIGQSRNLAEGEIATIARTRIRSAPHDHTVAVGIGSLNRDPAVERGRGLFHPQPRAA